MLRLGISKKLLHVGPVFQPAGGKAVINDMGHGKCAFLPLACVVPAFDRISITADFIRGEKVHRCPVHAASVVQLLAKCRDSPKRLIRSACINAADYHAYKRSDVKCPGRWFVLKAKRGSVGEAPIGCQGVVDPKDAGLRYGSDLYLMFG